MKPETVEALRQLQKDIHDMARAKGWWPALDRHEGDPATQLIHAEARIPEAIALTHSELSEALEEFRAGYPVQGTRIENGKPEGFGIELADAVIRAFDLAGGTGIDLARCIEQKVAYNATRPHLHGNKRA